MLTKCNKIQVGFLLLLSALPVLIVIAFIVRQQYIWVIVENELEKKQLVSLTILAKDFKWHKQNKEISVNGHLFDVKSTEKIQPGVVKVTGLYDWQEELLYKELDNFMNDEENKSTKQQQAFIKWITAPYDSNLTIINFLSSNLLQNTYSTFKASFVNKRILKIELPPPRFHS